MNKNLARKGLLVPILAASISAFWMIDFSASISRSSVEFGQPASAKPRGGKWGWLKGVVEVVLPSVAEGTANAAIGQITNSSQNKMSYVGEFCTSNGYRYFHGADGQWYAPTVQGGIVNVRAPGSYRCITEWYVDSRGNRYYRPI